MKPVFNVLRYFVFCMIIISCCNSYFNRISGRNDYQSTCLSFTNQEYFPRPFLNHKIAILIDGDNAEASLVAEFIAEAGRFGKVTVKRIYADWTSPQMKGWKEQLNSYAVRPIQKFAYTKAKSSTDTALIIDAMDLLHSKLVDGFCIVSSDSDYTGLAHRIREEGLFIMGIGKSHTPEAFVKACESFTFSEILSSTLTESMSSSSSLAERLLASSSAAEALGLSTASGNSKKAYKSSTLSSTSRLTANSASSSISSMPTSTFKKLKVDLNKVDRAFRIAMDIDTGHCMLSRLSEELRKLDPTFDHRNFGYSSFRRFCEALTPNYELFFAKDGTTLYIMESGLNRHHEQQQQVPADSFSSSSEQETVNKANKSKSSSSSGITKISASQKKLDSMAASTSLSAKKVSSIGTGTSTSSSATSKRLENDIINENTSTFTTSSDIKSSLLSSSSSVQSSSRTTETVIKMERKTMEMSPSSSALTTILLDSDNYDISAVRAAVVAGFAAIDGHDIDNIDICTKVDENGEEEEEDTDDFYDLNDDFENGYESDFITATAVTIASSSSAAAAAAAAAATVIPTSPDAITASTIDSVNDRLNSITRSKSAAVDEADSAGTELVMKSTAASAIGMSAPLPVPLSVSNSNVVESLPVHSKVIPQATTAAAAAAVKSSSMPTTATATSILSSNKAADNNNSDNEMNMNERRIQSRMKAIEQEMMELLRVNPNTNADAKNNQQNSNSNNKIVGDDSHTTTRGGGAGKQQSRDSSSAVSVSASVFTPQSPSASSSPIVSSSSLNSLNNDKFLKAASVTAVREKEKELERESMSRLKALRVREIQRKLREDEEKEAMWYFSRYEDD